MKKRVENVPKLKIMSWNINNFGYKKTYDDFYRYISSIIYLYDADIVGIIEIVSSQGVSIAENLVKILNSIVNPPGLYYWQMVVSDQFLKGGHYEQYIILYKCNINILQMNHYGLVGIINDHDFHNVFNSLNYPPGDPRIHNFYNELINNNYIDDGYRVPSTTWSLLNNGYTVKLPHITNDPNIERDISNILLQAKPYYFSEYWDDRTPFRVDFTLMNNVPLSVYLFHAPAPGYNAHFGNSQLGQISELATLDNVVLMGDFNIKQNELNKQLNLWYFNTTTGETELYQANGNNCLIKIFQTLTGPNAYGLSFLSYKKELDNTPTSLVVGPIAPNVTDPNKVYSSTYDNFFIKKTQLGNSIPYRIDTISFLTNQTYFLFSTQYAVNIYNNWLTAHNQNPFLLPIPTNLSEAFNVYRYPISDHVPILLCVDY
ncbi:MAG: hypothetical protein N4A63_04285 [Vallitalea sp.]|jgi:hypothetical protein|nr:hypothetical protein [Vallitalea sp.]